MLRIDLPKEVVKYAVSVNLFSPDYLQCLEARPVSCYAFFKRWLLPSQLPGCHSFKTPFRTQRLVKDLNIHSGLFPSWEKTFSSFLWLSFLNQKAFRVSVELVKLWATRIHRVLYILLLIKLALPKQVSQKISYLRVRLAFHSYPKVIPVLCYVHGFHPPIVCWHIFNVLLGSSLGFGSYESNKYALFKLAFALPPNGLSMLDSYSRWFIMQKEHQNYNISIDFLNASDFTCSISLPF